jgi:hypothetical protein
MAVGALTVTEARTSPANVAVKGNAVYTRTVTFTPDGGTAGTANLTGFIVPANTIVLGATVKFPTSQGACTWLFTVGTAISGATTCTSTATQALASFAQAVVATDTQVTYTTATAVSVACTAELTLVLCPVGTVAARSASVGN